MQCETVCVRHPSGHGVMWINKEDFDPAVHVAAEPEVAPAPKPEPVAAPPAKPRKPAVLNT